MRDFLNLLLAILACYRMSRLIAIDEGPSFSNGKRGIFHQLRVKLGAYDYGANGEAKTNIGRGISCVHCVGVWVAIPLSLYVSGIQWHTVLWWLTIAGGSSFLWSLRNDG